MKKYNKTNQLKRTEYYANWSVRSKTPQHTTYYEVIFTHQWSSLENEEMSNSLSLEQIVSHFFRSASLWRNSFSIESMVSGCVNEITWWPSWQHPQRSLLCSTAATCYLSDMSNTIGQACIKSEIKADSSIKYCFFLHFQFGSKTVTDMLHTHGVLHFPCWEKLLLVKHNFCLL